MKDNPLEKDIEGRVCTYAREENVTVFKFTSPARAAVPDRLFLASGGRIWWCEFKRRGEKPTAPQEREHARLRALGQRVYVIDNVTDGKAMVDAEVARDSPDVVMRLLDDARLGLMGDPVQNTSVWVDAWRRLQRLIGRA